MSDKKKVGVVGHLRGGKAVRPHNRLIEEKQSESGSVFLSKKPGTLLGLSSEEVVPKETTAHNLDFSECSLSGRLEYEKYENCVFSGVEFEKTDLTGVEFFNCRFQDCLFEKPEMLQTTFKGCLFEKTGFVGKNEPKEIWQDVMFENCRFVGGRFLTVHMKSGGFHNCSFDHTDIQDGTKLEDCTVNNSSFKNVHFTLANFPGTFFDKSSFHHVQMRKIGYESTDVFRTYQDPPEGKNFKIRECVFERSSIRYSNIRRAEIVDCKFDGTYFEKVEARQVNFSGAQGKFAFRSSDLNEANFTDVNMEVTFQLTPVYGATWKNSLVDCHVLGAHEYALPQPFYEQYSFKDVIKHNGLTDKQFEFMVLSGVIQVYDNIRMKRVESGFNPGDHHVPPWTYESIKNALSSP